MGKYLEIIEFSLQRPQITGFLKKMKKKVLENIRELLEEVLESRF